MCDGASEPDRMQHTWLLELDGDEKLRVTVALEHTSTTRQDVCQRVVAGLIQAVASLVVKESGQVGLYSHKESSHQQLFANVRLLTERKPRTVPDHASLDPARWQVSVSLLAQRFEHHHHRLRHLCHSWSVLVASVAQARATWSLSARWY